MTFSRNHFCLISLSLQSSKIQTLFLCREDSGFDPGVLTRYLVWAQARLIPGADSDRPILFCVFYYCELVVCLCSCCYCYCLFYFILFYFFLFYFCCFVLFVCFVCLFLFIYFSVERRNQAYYRNTEHK